MADSHPGQMAFFGVGEDLLFFCLLSVSVAY